MNRLAIDGVKKEADGVKKETAGVKKEIDGNDEALKCDNQQENLRATGQVDGGARWETGCRLHTGSKNGGGFFPYIL